MRRSSLILSAFTLIVCASGCADGIARAYEEVVRAGAEGLRELGRTRPATLAAAGELRCEGPDRCDQAAGTLGCTAEPRRFSAAFHGAFAPCVDACGDLRSCFDEAVASAAAEEGVERADCEQRLAECAVTSDACAALGVLSDAAARAAVSACVDAPCGELQRCLGEALAPQD